MTSHSIYWILTDLDYHIVTKILCVETFFPLETSTRRLSVILDGKSLQKYPVYDVVPQGSILGPTLFLLHINDLDDAICNIVIYVGDTTVHSK